MIREDIQIIQRKHCTIIASAENMFSFSECHAFKISAFSSFPYTMPMLEELEASGIIEIESCNEDGCLMMIPRFGYDTKKMTDLVVFLFEKYNL